MGTQEDRVFLYLRNQMETLVHASSYDYSRCRYCGAVVTDIDTTVLVKWHLNQEKRLGL